MRLAKFVACIAGMLISVISSATTVDEIDLTSDAGDTPDTATIIYGSGTLDQINGHVYADSRRVDMFGIYLSADSLFRVSTEITSGNPGYMNMFLFDDQGIGLIASMGGSSLTNIVPVYSGLYYIAVAQIQTLQPYSDSGQIFTQHIGNGTYLPGSSGGDLPVTNWGGTISGNFYEYSIHLTGASFVSISTVPAPPTFILMLTGIGLLGLTRRNCKAG